MRQNKEIIADISGRVSGAAATLKLPANAWEIEDALLQARVDNARSCHLTTRRIKCLPAHLTKSINFAQTSDLYELNFLAERLAGLKDSDKSIFQGLVQIQPHHEATAAGLMNLTYNLRNCKVIHGVSCDADLGKLAMEHPDPEDMADLFFNQVNFEEIGRGQRELEGGIFTKNMYLALKSEISQVYDGNAPLPVPMPHAIEMDLDGQSGVSHLQLPCHEDTITEIFSMNHALSPWDISVTGYRGRVAMWSEDFYDPSRLPEINELAGIIAGMDFYRVGKFKALLAARRPIQLNSIIDLAQNLDNYEFYREMSRPEDFAGAFLERMLGAGETLELSGHASFDGYGRRLMQRDDMAKTRYGFIAAMGHCWAKRLRIIRSPTWSGNTTRQEL